VNAFFTTVLIDLEVEGRGRGTDKGRKISIAEKEIGQLSRELKERRLQGSLITAQIRKELFCISNTKKATS
jgi:hypothetical protein